MKPRSASRNKESRYFSVRGAGIPGVLTLLSHALSPGAFQELVEVYFLGKAPPPVHREGKTVRACPGEAKKVAHAP